MSKLSLRHEIDCDADTFWKQFFDPELNAKLFREGLGFRNYETVGQTETDASIARTINAEPQLTVPAPIAKLMGASFRFAEEGTFDKATRTWRWKMIPSALSSKVRVEGKLTAVPTSDGKVRREIEIDIEAKVLMLGGLIEETFRKQLTEGWEKGAKVQNEWLKEQQKAS
jgi:hypothetical protein